VQDARPLKVWQLVLLMLTPTARSLALANFARDLGIAHFFHHVKFGRAR